MATAASVRAQEDSRVPVLRDRQTQIQREVPRVERESRAPGAVLTQTPGVPPATNAALARTDIRLGGLEDDVRTLTGRLEQLGYDIRQLSDRMDKATSDLEFRLRRLEEQAGIATAPASGASANKEPSLRQPAPVLGGAPPRNDGKPVGEPTGAQSAARAGAGPEGGPSVLATVPRSEREAGVGELRRTVPESVPESSQAHGADGGLPEGTPQEQYAYAFGLLQASQYDQAEQALKSFLLRNPDDPLSDNARYWLGETYYVRGQYPEAAQQFVEAYEKNRSGPKSADVLLKLGMSLSQLGKREEACATFRELSRTQPDAPEAVRTKVAKEAQRTGCT
jgi:tol-pal system protein YbgF